MKIQIEPTFFLPRKIKLKILFMFENQRGLTCHSCPWVPNFRHVWTMNDVCTSHWGKITLFVHKFPYIWCLKKCDFVKNVNFMNLVDFVIIVNFVEKYDNVILNMLIFGWIVDFCPIVHFVEKRAKWVKIWQTQQNQLRHPI